MGWIDSIVNATVEAEAPERFQYWAAMTAIAAVARKNVWINRHYYKLYPNLYVILVGKSGLRKGGPVSLSKALVTATQATRVITGRGSFQAIITELSKAHPLENGHVIKDAQAFIVSGEAASFFVKDPDALTVMTDLYNTHEHETEFVNLLKSSGKEVLKSPCLTLLWATNEEHLHEAIDGKDIKGGFIARSLVVLEESRRGINDLMDAPKVIPDRKVLADELLKISQVTGEFQITPDARDVYRNWYHDTAKKDHDDPTGTIERLGDTILKVAMALSLSEKVDLCITAINMKNAIDKCIECVGGLRIVTMGSGKSDLALPMKLVIRELLNRPDYKATRRQLLSKYWGEFDAFILDRIVQTLEQNGTLTVIRNGINSTYILHPVYVEFFRKQMSAAATKARNII